ncbi:unnamed protein product [Brugia timori]|uniref:Uncharacterized protein n=1 Tax=Brugia timori TaxID=42155 RepID=A0A3P7YXP6_9BILA|nr:unnamed protein product [Brugia timori]
MLKNKSCKIRRLASRLSSYCGEPILCAILSCNLHMSCETTPFLI